MRGMLVDPPAVSANAEIAGAAVWSYADKVVCEEAERGRAHSSF